MLKQREEGQEIDMENNLYIFVCKTVQGTAFLYRHNKCAIQVIGVHDK